MSQASNYTWKEVVPPLAVLALLGAGSVLAYNGGLGTSPWTCSNITASRLNDIMEGRFLSKIGVKILDVVSSTENGSQDPFMDCRVHTVTTSGEKEFHVNVIEEGGKTYVQMVPY